jgi:hypothetical protein
LSPRVPAGVQLPGALVPGVSFLAYLTWLVFQPYAGRPEEARTREGKGAAGIVPGIEIIDIAEYRPARIPSPLWRECIKRVWEVDPLSCPRCHAEMKIISFIVQPEVIRKILVHLELWEEFFRRPPPMTLAAEKAEVVSGRAKELFDDGWPSYEEPWEDVLHCSRGE